MGPGRVLPRARARCTRKYDVRESGQEGQRGEVRNLGKPVGLAQRYFEDGADEVVFLNITSFREVGCSTMQNCC